MVLTHLGMFYLALRDPGQALFHFEQALELARAAGDRRHQGELLWYLAIQHAEVGQRAAALVQGEAAVNLMKEMGNPEATAYQEFLEKYRQDAAENPLQQPVASYQPVIISAT